MRSRNLHSALKSEVVTDLTEGGIHYKHVRLQHGRDDFLDTLHARPNSWSTAGIQATDFLYFLGFSRSSCAFHNGECYCRELPLGRDVPSLAKAIARALEKFKQASNELENCGLNIDQPEGWGFFFGKPSSRRNFHSSRSRSNGHIASKVERMEESEDSFFRFVFTWVDNGRVKGWTTHYRAKHMPLSPEFQAALDFLGGFSWFGRCPEFDFEGCWWRFTPFRDDVREVFNRSAENAHRWFDAHAIHFSPGLEHLLAAHAELEPYGLSFLVVRSSGAFGATPAAPDPLPSVKVLPSTTKRVHLYDVAVSFAGTERRQAEELAKRVSDAGFEVFYDGFYPEQLWGKDLVSFFDRIYRKDSRFCVMFISREYAERMWTNHERRSAQARAIQERGFEYILPIRVDDTDLDGFPPTVGHLSLKEYSIEQIAGLLVKKLKSST